MGLICDLTRRGRDPPPLGASEMTFKRGDTSSLDPVWPIYGALDLTPEGRGDSAAYPNLQY